MQYHVTAVDIELGVSGNPELCPIALAIQRVHPGAEVQVWPAGIHIDYRFHPTPSIVHRFISDFDNALDVEPILFDLA